MIKENAFLLFYKQMTNEIKIKKLILYTLFKSIKSKKVDLIHASEMKLFPGIEKKKKTMLTIGDVGQLEILKY